MDFHALVSFAAVTAIETITPGPTLALVLETRGRGRGPAIASVIGITLANIVWIVIVLLGVLKSTDAPRVVPWLRDFAAAYLILLSTRRILSSAVGFITGAEKPAPDSPASPNSGFLWSGFWAHLLNPVTPPFYLSVFAVAVSNQSVENALLFGGLPILFDLVIYLVVAAVRVPTLDATPPIANGIFRLIAGGLLLFLVAHSFSINPPTSNHLNLPGVMLFLMLLGFLGGAITEAYDWVKSRAGLDNKLLWRVVAMWNSWFSATALIGAVYALIEALNQSAIPLDDLTKSHVRISFVIAAGVAVSLSLAKAFGEVQDEQSGGKQGTAIEINWTCEPLKAGLGTIAFTFVMFVILRITGLQLA